MDTPPVQYLRTGDGFNIAYARTGRGRPLVFVPLNFSHIQVFWKGESILAQWLHGLAARFEVIQYDGQGQGMSTRGLKESFSALDQVSDLQAVVDHLGLESFVLLARGPNGHAAIRFAAANPQRVDALILFSLPAVGTAWPQTFAQALPAENWKLFLQSFTAFDGRLNDADESVERMAQTVNQQDWNILIREWLVSDVRDLLPLVQAPTLVIHPRSVIQPAMEDSMNLAAEIPNSRMLLIGGASQLGNPEEGLSAIDSFLAGLPPRGAQPGVAEPPTVDAKTSAPSSHVGEGGRQGSRLSPRQLEILGLLVSGKTNREIASDLVLSLRTVERHVNDIYERLGVRNRTEAVAFALRNLH